MEFHFRRHFRLRPKMKNAFSVGLYIKLFQIIPYVNDFQTFNNPGSKRCLEKLVLPSILTQLSHPSSSSSSSPMVDKPDRWSTSICIGDMNPPAYIKYLLLTPQVESLQCRRPKGSMLILYLRAQQTLSVLGTGVLWCWYWENCNSCREFITEQASPILRRTSGRQ